jgi:hypothetical protein
MARTTKTTILALLFVVSTAAMTPSLAVAATRNPKTLGSHRQPTRALERHSSVYEPTICLPSDCYGPRETFSLEFNCNDALECF